MRLDGRAARALHAFGRRTIPGMKRILLLVFSFSFFLLFSHSPPRAPCASTTTMAATRTMSGSRSIAPCSSRWSGLAIPSKAIDESQLGNYLFEVREQGSGKLLYSRGFSSVFAEWKTTEEAQHANRTFSESLRFPAPAGPVEVLLKERNEKDPTAGFPRSLEDDRRSERQVCRPVAATLAGCADHVAEDGRSGGQSRSARAG